MRGQISLEYLMISVVSLSLIFISLLSLMAIKDSSMKALEILKFKSSIVSLSSSINEVCALGNGNSQSLDLTSSLSMETTKTDHWLVRFSNGNLSLVRPAICQVEAERNLEGLVYVKNENGLIRVR